MNTNLETKNQTDLVLIVPPNLKEAESLRQKLTDNALLLQNNMLTLQNIQIQTIANASQSVSEYESLLADSTKDFAAVKLQIQALDTQISWLREQKELGVLQNAPVVAKLLFRPCIPRHFGVRNFAALGMLLTTIGVTVVLCSAPHWMMLAGAIMMAGLWSTVHLNSIKYRAKSTERILSSKDLVADDEPVAAIADKLNPELDPDLLAKEVVNADEVKKTWMNDLQLVAQSKQLIKDWNEKIKECGLGDTTNKINFVIFSTENVKRGAAELAARAFNESKQFSVEVKPFGSGIGSHEIYIKSK